MPDRTVNPRYLPFTLTVPINTAQGSPVSVDVTEAGTVLESVHLIIPAGHAGLTGFQVRLAGMTILPFGTATDWIVGNGTEITFDMGDVQIDTVTLRGFNTDTVYTHKFYGQLKVRDIDTPAPAAPAATVVPITRKVVA